MLKKAYNFNNTNAGTILFCLKIMFLTFTMTLFYPMYTENNTTLKTLSYRNLVLKEYIILIAIYEVVICFQCSH